MYRMYGNSSGRPPNVDIACNRTKVFAEMECVRSRTGQSHIQGGQPFTATKAWMELRTHSLWSLAVSQVRSPTRKPRR